ncbi:MAG TPA: BON domain-containing protein [Chloroflexota bacterium]|nr:BON domain-containing protein [Chloroflexota bacterium]
MERNNRGFDEPRGTEINPDTLSPEQPHTGPELEGDFSLEQDTSTIDVTEVTQGDVYFPPVDPPVRAVMTNSREGIAGGFEDDSMSSMEVAPSVSGGVGDEALADAIRRELREDSATSDLRIRVAVEDGVAYLHGRVADLEDVDAAEEVAGRVPGVREVVEELQFD